MPQFHFTGWLCTSEHILNLNGTANRIGWLYASERVAPKERNIHLALLVENLHSYIDDFLSYVIQGLSTRHDINSLCQELFAKECDWIVDFSNRKAVMTDDVVTKMLSI